MAEDRAVVVGLGNPGPRYAATRHNAGFLVVDLLAHRLGARFKSHKAYSARADVVEGRLAGLPVVLVKPRSYMNDSGAAIVSVARFYKLDPTAITIVHDELDLPFGALRLKRGGGDGGHNGLRSATAALGTNEYLRVRFGIGRPPGRQDPAEFVLRDFASSERKELPYLVDRAADAVQLLLSSGLDVAQNSYND